MTEMRKRDPDEIPLPEIAHLEGGAMTLKCRTPQEAYLICDELEKADVVTILPNEEELVAQFKRNGYVEVRVSAKTYASLADLRSTVEFQYKQLRAERPLPPLGKLLGIALAFIIVPGLLVFVWLLTSYQKNGYVRMARDLKIWFCLGIAAWALLMALFIFLPHRSVS